MAEPLCIYSPNHGYSEDDIVWVSHLADYYYVDDPDTDSFYITDGAAGDNVDYESTITSGWTRQVESNSSIITIRNLGHLEGEQVVVTAGGTNRGTYTVSDAQITLTDHVYTYRVGLLYACKIKSMRFAVPSNNNIQYRIKKINDQTVRYMRSKDIEIGQEYGGTEYMSKASATYTDKSQDINALNHGGYDKDGYSVIKSVTPFPMTVLGIIVDIDVTDKS